MGSDIQRKGTTSKRGIPWDCIQINGLQVQCIIGFNPEERVNKQIVEIDIKLYTDISEAARTDSVEDAVDYKAIKKQVLAMVKASSFNLLETLTEQVAAICLQDRKVEHVTVKVAKPGALSYARSPAVEITRLQNSTRKINTTLE